MKKLLTTLAVAALAVPAMFAQDNMYVARNTTFMGVVPKDTDQQLEYNADNNTYSVTFEATQNGGFKFYTGPAAGTATTWYLPSTTWATVQFSEPDELLSTNEDGEPFSFVSSENNTVAVWYITKFAGDTDVKQGTITVVLYMDDNTITFQDGESQEIPVITHDFYLRGTSTGTYSSNAMLETSEGSGIWTIEMEVPKVTEPWEIEGTPIDHTGYGFSILDKRTTTTETQGTKIQDVLIGLPISTDEDGNITSDDPEITLSADQTTYTATLADKGAEMYITKAGRYSFTFNENTYELTITLLSLNNNTITLKFEGVSLAEQLPEYFTLMQGAYEEDADGDMVFNVSEVKVPTTTYNYAYSSQFLLAFFPKQGANITFSGEGMGEKWYQEDAQWPDNREPADEDEDTDYIPPKVIVGDAGANGSTIIVNLSGGFTFTVVAEDDILKDISEYVTVSEFEGEEVSLVVPTTTVSLNGNVTYVITPKEGYDVVVDCTNYEGPSGNKPYAVSTEADGSTMLSLTGAAIGLNFKISVYNISNNITVTLNYQTELPYTAYRLVNVTATPSAAVVGDLNVNADIFQFACQPPVVLTFTSAEEGYVVSDIECEDENVAITQYDADNSWTVTINEGAENPSIVITVAEDDSTAINGINAVEVNAPVYNLQGVKVADSLNGLAKGIYIINGKKVMVK